MGRGLFITLEGGEGTGKSTQAARIAEALRVRGHTVVTTREPGGTPQGENVRRLLVSGDTQQWSPAAEAMLMSAARAAHVAQVIEPSLATGKIVICDRFTDSTRVYQGLAGGAGETLIAALEQAATGGLKPDLTLVFDLAAETGLARARDRGTGSEDRFERKGISYHEKLRAGFLALAKSEPGRCKIIDAGRGQDAVFNDCWRYIEARLNG